MPYLIMSLATLTQPLIQGGYCTVSGECPVITTVDALETHYR